MTAPPASLAMSAGLRERLFSPSAWAELAKLVAVDERILTEESLAAIPEERLATTEVLITGWGCPQLSARLLDRMPRLHAVIHTAGSVKDMVSAEVFRRGIVVTSNADINAIPVAEFTLATILLSGKRAFQISRDYVATGRYRPFDSEPAQWGNRGLRVGIIGASRIGRRVIELLAPFDMRIAVCDPTLTEPLPGTRLVDLDELMRTSDVVSIHAPAIDETRNLVDARALSLMPDGATLINTARGSLIDTGALIGELRRRRLHAVLDVTEPDPLPADSELFDVPNLVLTPHIAGSMGSELFRLGDAAVDEVARLLAGEPLQGQVQASALAHTA